MLSLIVLINISILVGMFAVSAATPDPVINLFESRVVLNETGTVDVTERIHFGAGVRIEREIPTRRLLWTGLREVSRIELVNAILDGEPVELASRSTPRGVLWTPTPLPTEGEHSMILRYRADARVFKGQDADLFIWDATGYRWDAPIKKVRVSFPKPDTAPTLNYSILSGKPGALIDNERRNLSDTARVVWLREEPLPPGEGIRLVLRLPRGSVQVGTPNGAQRKLRDNLHVALGFFGAAALALFVLFKRLALNCDPDPKSKLDGPGADLSYGGARFLVDGRYTGRTLQVGILGLLAKRWLSTLKKDDSSWTFTRGESENSALTIDERALGEALLSGKEKLTLVGSASFETAINEHARAIEGLWLPLVRKRAWTAWACGIAWTTGIFSAMRAGAALFEPVPIPLASTLAIGAACTLGGFILVGVWTITYQSWRAASLPSTDGKARMIPLLASIGLGFLSFGLVTGAAGAFQTAVGDLAPAALLAGFSLLFVNWIAFYALRGPTPEGFNVLRRARLLSERGEENRHAAALTAIEPLVRAIDGYL